MPRPMPAQLRRKRNPERAADLRVYRRTLQRAQILRTADQTMDQRTERGCFEGRARGKYG